MTARHRLMRAASDTTTPAPLRLHYDRQLSASEQQRRRTLEEASTASRLPSTRGVSQIHTAKDRSTASSSASLSPAPSPSFRRPFLSPMDRIFIFFFEPSTRGTDVWSEEPSPVSSLPSPSESPRSPVLNKFFSSLSPQHSAFSWLPRFGYALLLLIALTLRVLMIAHPYSGEHTPPMFGDYEAQRHWMELTVNLPVTQWYRYDLQYWGLDYPPLTAYVSQLFGVIAQYIEPSLVALDSSRGYESPSSRLYMRLTVLVCDLLVFLPSLIVFTRYYYNQHKTLTAQCLMIFVLFIHPAFILIDHGHFQYNCVALGLTVWSGIAMIANRPLIASVLFCLALGFKQMALYYAPVFFVYLLIQAYQNATLGGSGGHSMIRFVVNVSQLALTVIVTFAMLLFPWLVQSIPVQELSQILFRLFPVARGLYEDKVANFWCASSIVIKWPQLMEKSQLVTLSMLATLAAFIPSLVHLFIFPSPRNCLYALALTSLSFFLFSFQVHEKTILFPLLPIMCLFADHPLLATWFSFIATFTMFPLLDREGLAIAYTASQLLFCAIASGLIGSIPLRAEKKQIVTDTINDAHSSNSNNGSVSASTIVNSGTVPFPFPLLTARLSFLTRFAPSRSNHLYPYVSVLSFLSLIGAIAIHFLALLLPLVWPNNPLTQRWPDALTLLFVVYGFVHFAGFFVFLYALQLTNVTVCNETQQAALLITEETTSASTNVEHTE